MCGGSQLKSQHLGTEAGGLSWGWGHLVLQIVSLIQEKKTSLNYFLISLFLVFDLQYELFSCYFFFKAMIRTVHTDFFGVNNLESVSF